MIPPATESASDFRQNRILQRLYVPPLPPQRLIAAGGHVHAPDNNQDTPLHWTAHNGSFS